MTVAALPDDPTDAPPKPKKRRVVLVPIGGTSALMTTLEFAAEIRLSDRFVRQACAAGTIKSITLGRSRRIPRAELARVLAEGIHG
jgi:excisionase family DNA binding protein